MFFVRGLQLEEAEKRLEDSQSKLARLRCQDNVVSSRGSPANGTKSVKVERRSVSPLHINEGSSRNRSQSRTELLIPAVNPKISEPIKSTWSGVKDPSGSSTQASPAAHSIGIVKVKGEKSHRNSSDSEIVEVRDRGTKRKFGNILT